MLNDDNYLNDSSDDSDQESYIDNSSTIGWLDFHEDNDFKLRRLFEYNIIDSDERSGFGKSMMHLAINNYALKCMHVLLDNRVEVTNEDWELAIQLDRPEFIENFLYEDEPDLETIQDIIEDNSSCKLLSKYYCKFSVLELLCISKCFKQPMSSMIVLIAKFLHNTRNDISWIKINK